MHPYTTIQYKYIQVQTAMTTHLAPALGWPLMTHILTSHPNTAKIHTHFLHTRPLIPLMWAGIMGELMDATVDSDTVGSMISGAFL